MSRFPGHTIEQPQPPSATPNDHCRPVLIPRSIALSSDMRSPWGWRPRYPDKGSLDYWS